MTTKPALRSTSAETPSNEHERLATLLQISEALASTLNAKTAIQEVLETLARRHAIARSLVVLVDDDGRQLHVEAAHGLNRPSHHIHYAIGEGVIGQVAQTGKAVVVPRVSREPSLVFRASAREEPPGEESSFVCVPIGFDRRVVGALGVNLKFRADRNYDRSKAFYSVAASMIGQALKVQRLVAAQHKRLVNENAHLKQELRERYDFAGIVGNSGPMQRVYEQVAQVARTSTTVLLRGESGTGKELIAHAIHYNSVRAKKPFVKVSCGALPDTLIESELFGYEKGAFTGAVARKKGRFEMAEGGTLFLDEIGDVNLGTQVKLLRVLQEREFE
ncbi:MAG: sigma 54-interacting transcriptional regulator, partial [Acidobacteriota bacterium]